MKSRVLLFGANGQLGSLIKEMSPSHYDLIACSSTDLDITNSSELKKSIIEISPSIIINAAAYTQVDKAEEDITKAYLVNEKGIENIALFSKKEIKVVHFSTDFVFDGKKKSAYLPVDETSPQSVYGKSKLAGEERLIALRENSSIIIRTAWLYSAKGKNFVNTMLRLFKSQKELSVVTDQIGTPTSAVTLAVVTWKLIDANETGMFHWTDKGEASWYEFACVIQEIAIEIGLLDNSIPIRPIPTKDYPTPAQRPSYSVLNKAGTYKSIGFEGKLWQEELLDVLLQIKHYSK